MNIPRDLSQLIGLALYLAAIVLVLTGAFMIWGWPVALIVAGVITFLVGAFVYD